MFFLCFYDNYVVVLLENVINCRNATKKERKSPSSTTIPKNAYCGILCFYNKMIVAELRFIVVIQYIQNLYLIRILTENLKLLASNLKLTAKKNVETSYFCSAYFINIETQTCQKWVYCTIPQ